MSSTAHNSGGVDIGVTADAQTLPYAYTKIKPNPPASGSSTSTNYAAPTESNGHVETVVRVIPRGALNKLCVSHVIAPNHKAYASLRVWFSADGIEFKPGRSGVMIRLDADLDAVISALNAVRGMAK